jgi:hypothetical protein
LPKKSPRSACSCNSRRSTAPYFWWCISPFNCGGYATRNWS